ncbi:DUF1711-domain-containing protein, partial [Trichoderma citrinoviride]
PAPKAADARRKSATKHGLLVTLSVPPALLRDIFPSSVSVKEGSESPASKSSKANSEPKESPASPSALAVSAAPSNGDAASDSNAATPAAEGTPSSTPMPPPTTKKGVKRSAAAVNGTSNDGIPKPRGKPGPKKKPRLEDGTIDHSGATARPSAHKLGPKANQGAINAGLRALDRSGKPCRRWAKGGFKLKSFTGVVWEIPRWTAPPRTVPESGAEDSAAPSADGEGSNKENKETENENGNENGNEGNSVSNSNSGVDVEMQSAPSVQASSPAPVPVAAAS